MLERFGLPTHLFGPIIEPGADLGDLRAQLAAETGLRGVKVIAPGTQPIQPAAVAAVPAMGPPSARPDWCYVSLGTWASVGAELDRPLVTPECMARNFTNEGGIGGTTRLLEECLRAVARAAVSGGLAAGRQGMVVGAAHGPGCQGRRRW